MEEVILQYIEPKLLILVPVLYLVGLAFKKSSKFQDNIIPIILGIIGIVLCALWVFATNELGSTQNVMIAAFTSIVQGVLVAGLSVYANQIVKQLKK